MSAAGRDEHLADRDALDVHAEDRAGDALGLVRRSPASLTPPALPRPPTRTWALITTCRPSPVGEEPLGGRPRLGGVWATSQAGTGSPWATSSDLASASWIFTRRAGSWLDGGSGRSGGVGRRDRVGTAAPMSLMERSAGRLAILIERGESAAPTAEGR